MRIGILAPVLSLALAFAANPLPTSAQGKVLSAMFTTAPIQVDGKAGPAWDAAPAQPMAQCDVSGTVKALWNGPLLYLLVNVTVVPRMYLTDTWGYGDRLPFDHHEEIAAIAPRAVLIDNTNDDYADNAESDSIGYEGAKPVYAFLGAPQDLALDIYMGGGGHSLKKSQAEDIVRFADFVLRGKPLPEDAKTHLKTDPYLDAGTYDKYYGGLKTMMPWAAKTPKEHPQR